MSKQPVTLFFLQASRSIRTAWLLEELNVPYTVDFSDRVSQKAPQEFKDRSGNPLGKFPCINDNGTVVYESGAIAEYLCETYDEDNAVYPASQPARSRAQIWLHAAEATFALHALTLLYAAWQLPGDVKEKVPDALPRMREGLSVNVAKDFDWLEAELAASTGPFLLGERLSVADIMMQFSVDFIQERGLGVKKDEAEEKYPKIQEWMAACMGTEGYKRAVQKTGHTLYPKTT